MTFPQIQNAVNAGELSPELFGRTDLDKYKKGLSTCRNMYASYRGGASSRAGLAYVGQCKQGAMGLASTVPPAQNIPFQFSQQQGIMLEFGDQYIRFIINGAYVTESPINITGVSKASQGVVTCTQSFTDGDWVYISGIVGMTQLNGRTFIVSDRSSTTFKLKSTLTGNYINTSAYTTYTSGGTAARIYTLATPYADDDVYLIKWTQSADVMTLTHPSYAPHDLSRITNDNWELNATTFSSGIDAPTTSTVTTSAGGTFYYSYAATAVDLLTGEESAASPAGTTQSVNIGVTAATITVNVAGVTGAGSYNFYRAPETSGAQGAGGALFGYVGTSLGPSFTDTNIVPDYSVTPPVHQNPFAVCASLGINMTNYGTSYSPTTTTVALSQANTGWTGFPVVINGQIQWVVQQNAGEGITSGATVVFTDASGGHSASATINIGPSTGTFPGVSAYFQQRRFYADSTNNPDTYWASQPGAFTNFDTSTPVQDFDAITGSPWSQQVNGIEYMINMPGGLVILTGLGAWQLAGGGGGLASATALTPSSQVATPQAYNGCDFHIKPIQINYDILYVQAKGAIVRDLSYNFFVNIYTGTDLTVLSNHLFTGHQIERWDWQEEPNKLLWACRDDGILLCLTYLKEQDVYAWTRHDSNGLFQSVGCIPEPVQTDAANNDSPIILDAAYFVVQRLIQNNGMPIYAYFQERMDNRIWQNIEDTFCVDAGLAYPQAEPDATLTVSSSSGVSTLNQPNLIYGGANYGGSTFGSIVDPTGSGAIAALTITGGAVTAASVSGTLTGYTAPQFIVTDPSGLGGGAAIDITLNNVAIVTAAPGVFANSAGSGAAGDVIRVGGGIMDVTTYGSSTSLTVNVLRPIATVFPDDPLNTPVPAVSGLWTIATPVITLSGLEHLEGMTASCLADGVIVEPQIVVGGAITLPVAASNVVAGLGFACQLQTMYFDMPGPTVQGRRKTIFQSVARVEKSAGPIQFGANQPDQSVQPNNLTLPWGTGVYPPLTEESPPITTQTPLQPFGLFTGDIFANISDALGGDGGQLAVQQLNPVPLNVLALVPFVQMGDDIDTSQ